MNEVPLWITELEEDELKFIRNFIVTSGSLKEMAEIYSVTYPTVRAKLNRIIEKVRLSDEKSGDNYERLIKKLAIEGKIEFEAAAVLIQEYRTKKEGG